MTPRGPIDEICVNTIRTLAIDAVQATRSGHPGTPLAMAPVVHTLWQDFLRCDPAEPRSLRAFFRPRFGAALRPIASERGWDGGSDSGRVPNTASPHRAGAILGMHTFGASALRAKFGSTGEHLYAAVRAQLARKE